MGIVAAYIRVSSKSQDHAYQRAAIERAATARGEQIGEWFCEKETAKRLARPELDRLRQHTREGFVAKIWVWRTDRLTRSGIRDTLALLDEFREHGASVASVADPFALDSEVVLAVMAWAAKVERSKIEENQAAARQRLEASGGAWGRPRRVSPELERKIRALRSGAEKMTIRRISIHLKVPRSTVAAVVSEKGPYRRKAENAKNKPYRNSDPPPSE